MKTVSLLPLTGITDTTISVNILKHRTLLEDKILFEPLEGEPGSDLPFFIMVIIDRNNFRKRIEC